MDALVKYTLVGGVTLAGRNNTGDSVIGLLYVKNRVQSKAFKPLDKQVVLAIFKEIRKNCYPLYKRLIPLHHEISKQFKGITPEEFRQIIEGPGSPIDFKGKMKEITEKAC